MLLESAWNCISLDRAGYIILIIRISAVITYTNTLFEEESVVNHKIFHGLTAETQSFVTSSFKKVTFSFVSYSWYILFLIALRSKVSTNTRRLLSPNPHYCPFRDYYAYNARLQCHKIHELVFFNVLFRVPLLAQCLSSFVKYSNTLFTISFD